MKNLNFIVSYVIYAVLSVTIAESYLLEPSRTPHGAQNMLPLHKNPTSQKMVPTLSHSYENIEHRKRHRSYPGIESLKPNAWSPPRGSYYSAMPMSQAINVENKGSVVDAISSVERSNRIVTNGVYKTYGKGTAVVPYVGANIQVPRSSGSSRAYKASVSTRVFDPPKATDLHINDVVVRSRRNCAGCPKDETVLAAKGNSYVILPHPCSHRWQTRTGPKPGTKIPEGVHFITGTMNHQRICQYHFQVKVRRCPPLLGKNVEVSCTADNAWGSTCNFTCPSNKIMRGSSQTECSDEEKWTLPEPICVENRQCLIPKIENGTKLSCETNEISDTNDNYMPEGAFCRYKVNGIDSAMRCRRGHWKKVQPKRDRRTGKRRSKKDWPTGAELNSHCDPNPCLNGGTCLFSTKTLHSTHICLCTPQTEGPRCEFTPCDVNPCKNGGRCLQVNNERNCFCPAIMTGSHCQHQLE